MKRSFVFAVGAVLLSLAAAYLASRQGTERDAMTALAGRVLLVGFEGREPGDRGVQRVVEQAKRGEIAGVMFLRRNVRDERQVKRLTGALAAASELPPLVALDQEGGRVARLSRWAGFERTPSAFTIAQTMDAAAAAAVYDRMASGLRDWGFNLNFGPVLDLHRADNPIIGRLGRSFGDDPDRVADYARTFMEAHRKVGVLTAIKHFPGHGSSVRDTHLGAVDVTATWDPRELEPFAALVRSAPLVMTAHVVNRTLGGDVPATFSRAVVTDLLRRRLGFRGAVVSDDLQMDAIADNHSEAEAAELAVRAGVDLVLFGNDKRNDPALVPRVTEHLAKAARTDPVFRARLEDAADRVDALRRGLVSGS